MDDTRRDPTTPLVATRDLRKIFRLPSERLFERFKGAVHAVDGVSLEIRQNEILGLVGETGSGKSTFGRLVMGLQEPTSGTVHFDGVDIGKLNAAELRGLRRRMQMVFQDPYASLNPRMTVDDILRAPLRAHGVGTATEQRQRAADLMNEVGLGPRFLERYPHQFSGGQQQRIAIARALILDPDFLVLDEPVSALDVSVQAQILNLLTRLHEDRDLTYLLIAHDLSIVRHVSDRVAVMYLGNLVEVASSDVIYDEPMHPYSAALISAIPIPDPKVEKSRERIVLEGDLTTWENDVVGCRFAPRCPMAEERCFVERPQLVEHAPSHFSACHFAERTTEMLARAGTAG